jgi:hypothetical protein
MAVLRDGPDVGEESGDAGPAEARNRPQVGGLLKVCQQGIDRVAVDLHQLEAPDSATGAVLAHTGHELPEGQGGHRGGGQAGGRSCPIEDHIEHRSGC